MTRDQIVQRIRDNLNDLGVTYYSTEDLVESIQDGYDEVAVYCECIEKNIILPFQSDLTYYDFSTLISDYYRVIRIFSSRTNKFMNLNLERENVGYDIKWELANYRANEFIILGPKYIGMSGRTANAEGNFKVWYKAQAPILNGSDVPRINDKYQILLENYSTADLLEQNQEFIKAEIYWNQYNNMLEDYRRKIQLLSKADRVFNRPAQIIH